MHFVFKYKSYIMHNSWGSYPIFYKTLNLWSILSVCWWTGSRFFLVLVPSWNFVESLVCLEPYSLLGVWYHFVGSNGYLIPWCIFNDIFQVMISPFGILFTWHFFVFGFGFWKSWACMFTSCISFGMFSFFDSIYRWNST